jgi:hypothetical protein
MRKCPKCGTILDDAKKKCYMCGSDIQVKTRVDFMKGFDDQVGATVTKSQDNVFNAVPDISVKLNDVVDNKSKNNNATFSSSSSSANFYKNEMQSLNSMQYDERTAIEKIFSNDSRFRSKDEINAEEAMKKNLKKIGGDNAFFSADVVNSKSNSSNNENVETNPFEMIQNSKNVANNSQFSNQQSTSQQNNNVQQIVNNIPTQQVAQIQFQQQTPQNQQMQQIQQNVVQPVKQEKKKKVKKEKAPINWGNNLQNSNGNNFSFLNKIKSLNISPSFIFNTVCFVLFATALIVMYFKFRSDPNEKNIVNIGELNYIIDDKFKLKNNDNFAKQYTYGDGCMIRIAFGRVSNVNDFIEEYYGDVKDDYSSDKGYLTQMNEMKINGNTWSEISVIQLKDNPASVGGYSPSAKYRFVTMIYNNKYYEIRYVNESEDNTCSAMYDDLITSLEFID